MNLVSSESCLLLALYQLKGIGSAFLKKHLALVADKSNSQYSDLRQSLDVFLDRVGREYSSEEVEDAIWKAEQILDECNTEQIVVKSFVDRQYPESLLAIKDAPPILFCKGDTDLLSADRITIVGTRHPNDRGCIIAERTGSYFLSKGWSICNGLAEGIDTNSIIGPGSKYFSKVVGVVGSGLSSKALKSLSRQSAINLKRVLENEGLVVSERPPSIKQDTFSVIKSCRIQAGLGKGTILIQSSLDGGSRFTIKAAIDAGRPLGIIQPIKSDYNSEGYAANRAIIERGLQGLGEFIELSTSNAQRPKIFVLENKSSYSPFEDSLNTDCIELSLDI